MGARVIEFPIDPSPNDANARPVDNGFTQRGASGPAARIDKPGSHWAMEITFPPMKPDVARKFSTRATLALSQGLRIEVPLLGVSQGSPGTPVVDGANPTGTTLPVRGLTPYYQAKEGYWLHIEDGAGKRCLHRVVEPTTADASGDAEIEIWPALWLPFADGDEINLSNPTIEGPIDNFGGWNLNVDQLVRFGGSIVVEESA